MAPINPTPHFFTFFFILFFLTSSAPSLINLEKFTPSCLANSIKSLCKSSGIYICVLTIPQLYINATIPFKMLVQLFQLKFIFLLRRHRPDLDQSYLPITSQLYRPHRDNCNLSLYHTPPLNSLSLQKSRAKILNVKIVLTVLILDLTIYTTSDMVYI